MNIERLQARKDAEIRHAELILEENEAMWGWSSHAGRRRAERRAALVSDAAPVAAGDRVLEIGCGTGFFTSQWRLGSARIVAADISFKLAREAARRYPDLTFLVADASALPFRTGALAGVIGSSVLHHLDETTALPEIKRVLAPGGRLAFAEPNMLNPQVMLQKNIPWLKKRCGDTEHETAFVRFTLAGRLARSGFKEISIIPFDFLHPAVPRFAANAVERIGKMVERLPGLREIAGSLLVTCRS